MLITALISWSISAMIILLYLTKYSESMLHVEYMHALSRSLPKCSVRDAATSQAFCSERWRWPIFLISLSPASTPSGADHAQNVNLLKIFYVLHKNQISISTSLSSLPPPSLMCLCNRTSDQGIQWVWLVARSQGYVHCEKSPSWDINCWCTRLSKLGRAVTQKGRPHCGADGARRS